MTDGDLPPTSPDPAPEPERGLLARARGHLMDLTPLRESRDFRLLFLGKSVSDFGDEIVATVVPFQVFQLTHSTLAVGLLGLCALDPRLRVPDHRWCVRRRGRASAVRDRDARLARGDVGADGRERDARRAVALAALRVRDALRRALHVQPAGDVHVAGTAAPTGPAPVVERARSGLRHDRRDGGARGRRHPDPHDRAGGSVRVRCVHVPVRDRDGLAHEALTAVGRRRLGELGGDRGRVPVPEGQAHDPVGVRCRSDRDDVRVPDGAVPGDRRAARTRIGGGRPRPALRGAGARRRSSPRRSPAARSTSGGRAARS